MSRATKAALQKLQIYVTNTKSRITKIIRGQAEPGTRAAPARTDKDDANIGLRLDYGERFTKDGKEYQRFKLQANKQAADSTIKAMAAKDSHKVLAEADLQSQPSNR